MNKPYIFLLSILLILGISVALPEQLGAADATDENPDTTAPGILPNPTYNANSGVLTVQANEAIDPNSINRSKFFLAITPHPYVYMTSSEVSILSDGTTIQFTLSEEHRREVISWGSSYFMLNVRVGAFSDTSGNTFSPTNAWRVNVGLLPVAISDTPILNTETGILNVAFDRPVDIGTVVTSGFSIRDSGGTSGTVTMSDYPHHLADDGYAIQFTLDISGISEITAMVRPALYLDENAVRGIVAVSDQRLTILDPTPPTISGTPTLNEGTGVLTVTFDETVNVSGMTASGFHIRESGATTGGTPMTGYLDTTQNGTTVQFAVTGTTHLEDMAALEAPSLYVDAGAIADIAGNGIVAVSDQRLTILDTTPPTISDTPTLNEGTGVLTVQFSEPVSIDTIVSSGFHIRESNNTGGITLSDYDATEGGSAVRFTLDESDRRAVIVLDDPVLYIDENSVFDKSNNGIAQVIGQQVTVTPDTVSPVVSGTPTFDEGTRVLTVTFDETVNVSSITASGFHIREYGATTGGVPMTGYLVTTQDGTTIQFTVTGTAHIRDMAALGTPSLYVDAGAIADLAGNGIEPVSNQALDITIDRIPPTVSGTPTLNLSTGVLSITFDEPLDVSGVFARAIIITERFVSEHKYALLSGSQLTAAPDGATIHLAMPESTRANVLAMTGPVLYLLDGAVGDVSGNRNSITGPIYLAVTPDTTPPGIASSSLDDRSGILSVTFDEFVDISTIQASEFRVQESGRPSQSATLSEDEMITASDNTAVQFRLGQINSLAIFAMEAPTLVVDAGAVRDISGNGIEADAGLVSVVEKAPAMLGIPVFDEHTRVVSVTFDEPLDASAINMTKFRIHEDVQSTSDGYVNVRLSDSSLDMASDGTTLSITLGEQTHNDIMRNISMPMLSLDADAVRDTSGNGIAPVESSRLYVIPDDIAPTILGMPTLNTITGTLEINFTQSIDVSRVYAPLFHIRDSDSETGGITLSGSARDQTACCSSVMFELTQSNLDAVRAMSEPVLDIEAYAVSDLSDNGIAQVTGMSISITPDAVPPSVSDDHIPELNLNTGVLSVTFDETINISPINTSGFHIRENGTSSGGITMTNYLDTTVDGTAVSFTLDESGRQAVIAMEHPALHIDEGSVYDIRNNGIEQVNNLRLGITPDTTPPSISGTPTLDLNAGVLDIEFDEMITVSAVNTSGFHIRENGTSSGGITMTNYLDTTVDGTAVRFTVNDAAALSDMAEMSVPTLYVDADAISDTSGNGIVPVSLKIPDTTPPVILGDVTINEHTRVMNITFSETIDIDTVNPVRMLVFDNSNASVNSFIPSNNELTTTENSTTVQLTLTSSHFAQVLTMEVPVILLDASNISDLAGNDIEISDFILIVIPDLTPPLFQDTGLDESTGILSITFSEFIDISTVTADRFHIREPGRDSGGVTLSGGELNTAENGDTIRFMLTGDHRGEISVMILPTLYLDENAVYDIAGNGIAQADRSINVIYDPAPPALSGDPELDASTGILSVSFNQTVTVSPQGASGFSIHYGDIALTMSDTELDTTDSGAMVRFTLDESDRRAIITRDNPTQNLPVLAIDADSVRDMSGSGNLQIANRAIRIIPDPVPPSVSDPIPELYMSTGVLTITFDEPIDVSSVTASGFHIRENNTNTGGISLLPEHVDTTQDGNTVQFTLDNSRLALVDTMVDTMVDPKMSIDANSVRDIAGNGIRQVSSHDMLIIPDLTPPVISGTPTLDLNTGVLTITFDEYVVASSIVASKLYIREHGYFTGGLTLSNSELDTALDGNTIQFTLNESHRIQILELDTPTLDVDVGFVSDLIDNLPIKQVSDHAINVTSDTTPPVISGMPALNEDTGVLTITFDEPVNINSTRTSGFHIHERGSTINGVTLSDDELVTTSNGTTIQFQLSSSDRQIVIDMNAPVLNIDIGSVSDMAGNSIAPTGDNRLDDGQSTGDPARNAPRHTGQGIPSLTISGTPTLNENTGVLGITFDEPVDIDTIITSGFHIREYGYFSGGITLSGTEPDTVQDGHTVRFTLDEPGRLQVAALEAPTLDIDMYSIHGVSGSSIALVSDQRIDITQNAPQED